MFPTTYQHFIYKRTYSRFMESQGRREDWPESVARYFDFFISRIPEAKQGEFFDATQAIEALEVMPSMRCMWSAGKALARENAAGYNCSYLPIERPQAFAEMLYILMCGAGAGFSVERQYINRLPSIPDQFTKGPEIVFEDSKKGWAVGLSALIQALYAGYTPKYNLSEIRPKGTRLKTFGGRASGPEPLQALLEFAIATFRNAAGRRLNSLEAYDMACTIANSVVVGGVRRSATLSLSNLSDMRMAQAKTGDFGALNPQRYLSNNSVAYTEKPDCGTFMAEWLNLMRSGSGERGIFNREAAKALIARIGRRDPNHEWGGNPCMEIFLRPYQFCNLSEAVIRAGDSLESIKRKVRLATILGTVQATLTRFQFLNRLWKKNTEEERLLGVSLTGLRDHEVLGHKSTQAALWLTEMKQVAIETAREWSQALEIPMPAAITCVKPSGTVSQLVNSASGLHPRFSPAYIRRVKVSSTDPLARLLIDEGVPFHPEPGFDLANSPNVLFDFPIKSPEEAVFRDEVGALEQLEYWKMLRLNWCEHNPSCTIYLKPDEWFDAGAWVYREWNIASGIAFFPYDNRLYQLPPYEEADEATIEAMGAKMPEIDFSRLSEYEGGEDMTTGAQEYACVGGKCEL